MTDYGERIIEARGSKKMSQTELAKQAGIARPTLSNIERGVAKPNPTTWHSIARVLEIDLSPNEKRAANSFAELTKSHAYCRGVLYEAIADIIGENETLFQNCSCDDMFLLQALALAKKAKPGIEKEKKLMKATCDIQGVQDTNNAYTLEEQGEFLLGYYHAKSRRRE